MANIITNQTIRNELHAIVDIETYPPCWLYNGNAKALPRISYIICPSGEYRNVSLRKAVYLVHRGIVYSNQIVYTRCAQYLCIKPFHLKTGTRAEYQRDMAKRRAKGRLWI